MKVPRRVADAVAGAEDALDRLKLAYKERFDRFDPARPVPYRGWGRPDRLVLRGRVLEDEETGFEPEAGLWTNIRNTIRRLETDEIRGALLRITYRDQSIEVRADDEAFFEVRLEPDPPAEAGWHEVGIEVVESVASAHVGPVTGEVPVTAPDADFLVVSDLDDTVVRTGATSRLSMFRTVLMNDAHSRVPFQGVRSFYHALAAGPSGTAHNPFFYVSRSAWNVYDMLAGFLDHHGLPKGPLLLKDYGTHNLLGYDEEEHKRGAIEELLEFYPGIPLLLIGDSGQRDPEIYRSIALDRPERVRTIIIRDVTTPERDREVHGIADEVRDAGVPMFLAADSAEAARSAAEAGLLAEDRLPRIEAERESDEPVPSLLARMRSGSGLRSRSADGDVGGRQPNSSARRFSLGNTTSSSSESR